MSVPSFVLVEGVVTGLSYGLLALGLVLIYRTNRVLNFAQGQLGVVAAVFMAKVADDWRSTTGSRSSPRCSSPPRSARSASSRCAGSSTGPGSW